MTEMTTRQLLWDSLTTPPAGHRPGRPGVTIPAAVEFTLSESVKHSPGEAGKTFERINALGQALVSHQGSGYERVIRADSGQRLSPAWLTTRSMVHDPVSGRIAAAAHLSHAAVGLPPALDLGAVNGRNMVAWREHDGLIYPAGNVYCGSTRSGALVPVMMSADTISVDLCARTGEVAVFESWGSMPGSVAVIDSAGSRRQLTFVTGVTAGEEIRFSPDGRWLWLEGGSKAWLIEVATGRWLAAPISNAAWWPLRPATLISVRNETGASVPRLYDLSSAEYVGEFPPLSIEGEGATEPAAWMPAVSPDGTQLLIATRAGISEAYRGEHGARMRAARVTLATGRGQLVSPIFMDDQEELEREQCEFRWTGAVPELPVTLAPQLAAQLQPPVPDSDGGGDPVRYADEAKQSTAAALNHLVQQVGTDLDGADAAFLMPEIVRGLGTLQHLGGEHWNNLAEWSSRVANAIEPHLGQGSLSPANEDAWRVFCSAVSALTAGQPERIDWPGLPWVRY